MIFLMNIWDFLLLLGSVDLFNNLNMKTIDQFASFDAKRLLSSVQSEPCGSNIML